MNLRKIKKYVSVIALTVALVFSGFAVPTRADGYNQGIVTFVTSLYSDCLGRTPDPAGLNDWCSKLASGQISGKQCAYGFFFSPEFQAKANAWDDTTFINAYYKEKYLNHKNPYEEMFSIGEQMKNLGEVYDEIVNGADSPIYTDQHSHSTTITLGHPVSIPREECDADQEHSCSRGLHCGAKGWLKQNYYGTVGLMVLVNPANVVAVPTIDEYGKMRTCEYFPVAIIDFDENGDIIENSYSLHSDVAYLKELRYEGDINNNDIDGYEISHTHATREEMYNSILSRLNAD